MLQSNCGVFPRNLDCARQCRHRRNAGRRPVRRSRAATPSATSRACAACRLPNLARLGPGQHQAARRNRRPPPRLPAPTDAARWPRPARTPPPDIGRWSASTSTSRFPLYPHGFPPEVMDEFERRIGRGTLGNKAASRHRDHPGTRRGAHAHGLAHRLHLGRQRVPDRRARRSDPAVGAVQNLRDRARDSARAARSGPGDRAPVHRLARQLSRAPSNRHDYAVPPPKGMLLDQLEERGVPVHSVGKIFDVFLGRGIRDSTKTKNNADGMAQTLAAHGRSRRRHDLRQPGGFRPAVRPSQRYGRLRRRARGVRRLAAGIREPRCSHGDLAIFTADHGCDPTTPSTDHSREYVPLLAAGPECAPASTWECAPRSPISARRWPTISAPRIAKGESFLTANRMRKPVMAGNWKMYKTPAETTAFFEKFRPLVENASHCEIVICPPFTNLAAAVDAVKGSTIRIGAQNIALGQGRRLHRRNLRPHAQRRRRHPRHHRPQRTPAVFRRDRRDRAQAHPGGARIRAHADRLRGRAAGRARERQDRSRAGRRSSRRASPGSPSSSSPRS